MYRLCMKRVSSRAACFGGLGPQSHQLKSSSRLAAVIPHHQQTQERLASTTPENRSTSSVRDFSRRHIGPDDAQTNAMLEYLQLQVYLAYCHPTQLVSYFAATPLILYSGEFKGAVGRPPPKLASE